MSRSHRSWQQVSSGLVTIYLLSKAGVGFSCKRACSDIAIPVKKPVRMMMKSEPTLLLSIWVANQR